MFLQKKICDLDQDESSENQSDEASAQISHNFSNGANRHLSNRHAYGENKTKIMMLQATSKNIQCAARKCLLIFNQVSSLLLIVKLIRIAFAHWSIIEFLFCGFSIICI